MEAAALNALRGSEILAGDPPGSVTQVRMRALGRGQMTSTRARPIGADVLLQYLCFFINSFIYLLLYLCRCILCIVYVYIMFCIMCV